MEDVTTGLQLATIFPEVVAYLTFFPVTIIPSSAHSLLRLGMSTSPTHRLFPGSPVYAKFMGLGEVAVIEKLRGIYAKVEIAFWRSDYTVEIIHCEVDIHESMSLQDQERDRLIGLYQRKTPIAFTADPHSVHGEHIDLPISTSRKMTGEEIDRIQNGEGHTMFIFRALFSQQEFKEIVLHHIRCFYEGQ